MNRPVNIDHHLQLKGHNVNLSLMSSGSVTMESDKFIACSLKTRISKRYSIFDLADIEHPLELTISTDSILVNPVRKEIIAAKSGNELQIYNWENGQYTDIRNKRIGCAILLYKWVNEKTIGFITGDAVYHWSLEGDDAPITMFSLEQKMIERCQIIDYRADSDQKLFAVVTAAWSGRDSSLIQLYDTESGQSQIMEGNAACFATIRRGNEAHALTVLVYSSNNSQGGNTVNVLGRSEIDNTMNCNLSSIPYMMESGPAMHITMHASLRTKRFKHKLCDLKASVKHGLVFILTKFGHVHIFDIESSTEVYKAWIIEDMICITTDYSKGGVMGITRKGLVLSVSINEQAMLDYVSQSNPELAHRLSQRWNIGVAPSAPPLTLEDQDEMGGRRRRRITTDDDPYPLTDTIKGILLAAGQDPSKMSKKEIKFVYDFIGKYQEDWIASEIDTPIYENLPLPPCVAVHPSEPVHPPLPAPRPSLAKSNNQAEDTDWKALAEKAVKERDDVTRKYQKLLMLTGRTERK